LGVCDCVAARGTGGAVLFHSKCCRLFADEVSADANGHLQYGELCSHVVSVFWARVKICVRAVDWQVVQQWYGDIEVALLIYSPPSQYQ
jgi:hypothetical protein